MGDRARTGDLVVVVPGVFGSRLRRNGSDLWGDGSPTFLDWIGRHAADLGTLTVGADDPTADDLGDGIVPGEPLEDVLVVGRFTKAGGYAPLVRALERAFGVRSGEGLRLFAYDWRRDVRVAARRLATCVDGWLAEWRARTGNPRARVALVGHGLGGLVCEHYAEIEAGWPSVAKLVTIGCPFQGSIRALDLLYFGVDFQGYGLRHPELTPVVRTMTSVYQLLPRYPSVRTLGGTLVSPFELRIPSLEQHKIERARTLHRELAERHARNRSVPGYDVARAAIVGIAQPTAELARLLANGTLAIEGDGLPARCDGDGVVPRFSAELAGNGFDGRWFYVPQSHGMLIGDPTVHALLRDLLAERADEARAAAPPLVRFTLGRATGDVVRIEADGLSLRTDRPFYRTGDPIEVHVEARSASGWPFDFRSARLRAVVEPVAGRGARSVVALAPDRQRPEASAGRVRAGRPGLYRLTVTSRNPLLASFPVGDYFEVEARPRS